MREIMHPASVCGEALAVESEHSAGAQARSKAGARCDRFGCRAFLGDALRTFM